LEVLKGPSESRSSQGVPAPCALLVGHKSGLAPHSGTDISQAGKGYPSLGTVRFALPAILTSCDNPEDPNE